MITSPVMTPLPVMTNTTNIAIKSIQCPTCGKYIDIWLMPTIDDEMTICGSCGNIINIYIDEEITNVQY